MSWPGVSFTLAGSDRSTLELPATGTDSQALIARIAQILGRDFRDNSVELAAERKAYGLRALQVCPPSIARRRTTSSSMSTDGRCATGS